VLAEPEAHGASPEALAGISEAWNALDKAVAGLSRRQRLIFELRFGQGKDLKEIARLISSSESNVKTHLMRMLAKLRRHLAPIWTGI
jgi:RNA polymerase sigma factor (sigma-70 family)